MKNLLTKTQLNTIKNVFVINLKIKKDEKVLIFTDNINQDIQKITQIFAKEGKKHTKNITYIKFTATKSHGSEPPENLWLNAFGANAIKNLKTQKLLIPLLNKKTDKQQIKKIEDIITKFRKEAVNVVIALSYYSTSHTRFRHLLTNICGTRYASLPLFDKTMLNSSMTVNWKKMAKKTAKIMQRVNKSEKIYIETPNGTHITLSKKGRTAMADTGIITKPGAFSNLPAGEVFFAPLENTAEGKLILEWAPTHKLNKPITLYVKKGKVVKIEGNNKYADYLKTKLSERNKNTNIAELGIGTNDKASRPDNILESEKILGTIHIALGDNSTFGGKVSTPFHQDFVFFKPTVTLIDKKGRRETLLENGRLISRKNTCKE